MTVQDRFLIAYESRHYEDADWGAQADRWTASFYTEADTTVFGKAVITRVVPGVTPNPREAFEADPGVLDRIPRVIFTEDGDLVPELAKLRPRCCCCWSQSASRTHGGARGWEWAWPSPLSGGWPFLVRWQSATRRRFTITGRMNRARTRPTIRRSGGRTRKPWPSSRRHGKGRASHGLTRLSTPWLLSETLRRGRRARVGSTRSEGLSPCPPAPSRW